MRIPYFPGCALKTTARNFEISALATAKRLGIEMIELPRWNCCGTVHSLVDDDIMRYMAPIRDLIHVQKMNEEGILEDEYRLVTLCSLCYNTLKRASIVVENDSTKLDKINTSLEEEYKGGAKVLHFLQILREMGFDEIAETVERPLTGLRIAPYYGCLLLRPKDVAIDDPEHPKIFEELLKALGAEVIDNPLKTHCCGSYHTVHRKSIVAELTYKNLIYPTMNGAEAIALTCPRCAFNLDNRQEEVLEAHHGFHEVPVFYFSQLMAIAFGLDEKLHGLDLNHVDPRPLLKEKGLV